MGPTTGPSSGPAADILSVSADVGAALRLTEDCSSTSSLLPWHAICNRSIPDRHWTTSRQSSKQPKRKQSTNIRRECARKVPNRKQDIVRVIHWQSPIYLRQRCQRQRSQCVPEDVYRYDEAADGFVAATKVLENLIRDRRNHGRGQWCEQAEEADHAQIAPYSEC